MMTERPSELCVVRIRDEDGWRAAFVIDGRRYPDPNAVQTISDEAFAELNRRDIPAEFETRQVSATEKPLKLLSWEEYRKRFEKTPEE